MMSPHRRIGGSMTCISTVTIDFTDMHPAQFRRESTGMGITGRCARWLLDAVLLSLKLPRVIVTRACGRVPHRQFRPCPNKEDYSASEGSSPHTMGGGSPRHTMRDEKPNYRYTPVKRVQPSASLSKPLRARLQYPSLSLQSSRKKSNRRSRFLPPLLERPSQTLGESSRGGRID